MKAILKTSPLALAAFLASLAFCATAAAGPGPPPTVPEIDPGSAVGAVTLLVGGVLSLVDRRRLK